MDVLIVVAVLLIYAVLVGVIVWAVKARTHEQSEINRDQVAAQRKANLVYLQKRASRQRHVH